MLTEAGSGLRGTGPRTRRRSLDWVILPLLSLATICVLFAAAETASRTFFPLQENDVCLAKGSSGDNRWKPNCTERLKNAEGPWVTYRYNECGYRGFTACGPKPPRTLRIALLGSSISQGLYIPYPQTFGERAAAMLSQQTGRAVEVQNTAVENLAPYYVAQRIDEALALQPDVIVYAFTTYDLQLRMQAPDAAAESRVQAKPKAGPLKRLQGEINDNSRAVLAAQHFFFADSQNYFRVHVKYGDNSNLFQQPLTPEWKTRLNGFEGLLARMSARCRAAGVPLVVMAVPSRTQAILLDGAGQMPGVDPFAFPTLVRDMATRVGCFYADVFGEFSRTPHSDKFFYPVDLHPNAEAHELLAKALVRKCLDGSVPPLTHTAPSHH